MGLLDNLGAAGYAGLGLLQSAGPSRNPQSPWAGLAGGLLAGREAEFKRQEMEQQRLQMEVQRKALEAQMQQAQQKAALQTELQDAMASGDRARIEKAVIALAPTQVASQLFATQKPMEVSAGATVYDPATNQALYTAPADPSKLSFDQRLQLAKARGPLVSMGEESAEAKAVGKGQGEMYLELQKAATANTRKAGLVRQINQLFGDAYTGTGGNKVQTARRLGTLLGIDPKTAGNVDTAIALSQEVALEMRNPSGGAGMPGALSDRDLEFLGRMSPGALMTPEGRRTFEQVVSRQAKLSNEIAQMARDYRAKHGRLDESFGDLVAQKYAGRDLFADLYGKMPAPASAPGPAAGQAPRILNIERIQ